METEEARITVNGTAITTTQINEEAQYHPSGSLKEAKHAAMQALVVRELLIQKAANENIGGGSEEDTISTLLENEIEVPEPDKKSCRDYYEQNQEQFKSSPLFEVSHILFLASPDAEKEAKNVLLELKENPGRFEELAREHSACSSAPNGGRMGQVSKGQTDPRFEAALLRMEKGDISSKPVESKFGFHIIKLHERAEGRLLPFESVESKIVEHMRRNAWQKSVRQYISFLGDVADIKGFILKNGKKFT